jgi:hypothetical protein
MMARTIPIIYIGRLLTSATYARSGPLPFLGISVHARRLARLIYLDGYWTVEGMVSVHDALQSWL